MAKPKSTTTPGNKVIATVKSVTGNCPWGHEIGDTFAIDFRETAGLCGRLFHDIYPYIVMLEFGGEFPNASGNTATMTVECSDRVNKVTMELHRASE